VSAYLEALFTELERLHPTCSATSHGIAWDADDGLLLLYNMGDVVMPFLLRPGDLGGDPIAAAADLHRRASAEAKKENARLITYKT
jgi:hypothetical protein